MARDRAKINTGIWGDQDWKQLAMAQQWLYTTILTRPELNHVGVGDWRPRRISNLAEGVTEEAVVAAAKGLQDQQFILIDEDTEEVLIRSFLKHDGVLDNPNLGASIKAAYDAIYSPMLQQVVIHELRKITDRTPDTPVLKAVKSKRHIQAMLELPGTPITDFLNGVGNGVQKGGGTALGTPLGTAFEKGDPSSTATTTSISNEIEHTSTADADGPSESELFDQFWAEYPRNDGKKKAREKFTQALKRADAETIIDAARRYSVDPNRSEAFTKQATTWLNGDHWEDPPLPPRNDHAAAQPSAADRAMQRGAERHQQIENGLLGQSVSWDDVFTQTQIER